MSRVDDSASLLDRVPFPRGGARPWQTTRERGSRQLANSRLAKNTLALILAGGRGMRLKGLTDWRAKPALFFGGKHRIIDFALSNCVNSGIRRIGICTQYKAQSLIRHVQRGWSFFDGRFGEFIELLPAQQRVEPNWYLGTADAVFQNLDIVRLHDPDYVLVLAGDHVYKMDYGKLIADHVARGAELTIACIEVPIGDATELGVVQVDGDGRIVRFDEKPASPLAIPGRPDYALASMGVYVFDAPTLYRQLVRDADDAASGHDFGRDVIPWIIAHGHHIVAHPFRDSCVRTGNGDGTSYWRDVGTIDAFYDAHMDLISISPIFNLYNREWPILTRPDPLPPAKFVFDDEDRRGQALDSMVCAGVVISGATARRSVLSPGARVHSFAQVEDSVLFQDVDVGERAVVRRAIVDKNVRIAPGARIGVDAQADRARFHVSDGGIVVIGKGATVDA